jgi:hypothetical protein
LSEPRITATSRYAGIEQGTHTGPDGTPQPYLKRRFLPRELPPLMGQVSVVQGDRPDLIAARQLGDAEAWWRLCDANGVLHPEELTAEIGATVRIGVPGSTVGGGGSGGGGA